MQKLNNKNSMILITSIVGLIVFMLFTNPREVPLAILLIPFLLIFTILFMIVRLIFKIFLGSDDNSAKSNLFSVVIAITLVNFLLLRSVDQLTIQDAVLSTLVTLILAIYINKFKILS